MFGVSIDSPVQNAAMIEKLAVPFPLLSDPDRSGAIEPFEVADPDDERLISRPAMVLLAPGGSEVWRFVSRDFADRLPEEDVLARVKELGWGSVTQEAPESGIPEPGPSAMPLEALLPYFRGARFAALAMGRRHGDHARSIVDDSKGYVAEMDRFTEAVRELLDRRRD